MMNDLNDLNDLNIFNNMSSNSNIQQEKILLNNLNILRDYLLNLTEEFNNYVNTENEYTQKIEQLENEYKQKIKELEELEGLKNFEIMLNTSPILYLIYSLCLTSFFMSFCDNFIFNRYHDSTYVSDVFFYSCYITIPFTFILFFRKSKLSNLFLFFIGFMIGCFQALISVIPAILANIFNVIVGMLIISYFFSLLQSMYFCIIYVNWATINLNSFYYIYYIIIFIIIYLFMYSYIKKNRKKIIPFDNQNTEIYNQFLIDYKNIDNNKNIELSTIKLKIKEIKEQILSETSEWYPIDYCNLDVVEYFINLVTNHEASNVKELIFIYKRDKYNNILLQTQNDINQALNNLHYTQNEMLNAQNKIINQNNELNSLIQKSNAVQMANLFATKETSSKLDSIHDTMHTTINDIKKKLR